jgi:L-ascorbate 6-phosphate lactonase
VEGKKILISGDTLYFGDAAPEIGDVDIAIVVMNGKGNNMNCVDAARYASEVDAKLAIPAHWGLFEKFSDDPGKFAAEAQARGVKTYIAPMYETFDPSEIL